MTTEPITSPPAGVATTEFSKEHEDPSLSSASLCIRFHMLGQTFGPVFTHQAFPGEWVRGYHPPLKKMMELITKERQKQQQEQRQVDDDDDLSTKKNEVALHSSHIHHEAASKELSIDIKLSPSCQVCQVNICTEQKRLPRRHSIRASKRRRVAVTPPSETEKEEDEESAEEEKEEKYDNDEANDDNNISSEPYAEEDDEDEKDDDSEFEADENESDAEEEEEDKEGATRKSRMPKQEILHSLKKGLPDVREIKVDDRYLKKPVGVELKEYSVKGKDFVLCLANGKEASKFHKECQRLALWFIETADDVDVASRDGGFWKVLYLLQKHHPNQYSLAGYTTLFHFHAPFKKPRAGYVVRICQALVLPPYQRSGHGKQMLTCVLDIAHGRYDEHLSATNSRKTRKENNDDEQHGDDDDDIVEINVEWPAPAFVLLRNKTDYDSFVRSIESKDPWYQVNSSSDCVTDNGYFTALPESETVKAAAKAKIIPRQIQIVEELFKLQKLHEHLQQSSDASSSGKGTGKEQKEELEKRFRLMVKKRLNKENREHLSGFRTKAEKQAFLEEEFCKCLADYRLTLHLTTPHFT